MGYGFYRQALEATLRYASAHTGLPLMVTENGLSATGDSRRLEYIRRALIRVKPCLQDGLDGRGNTYWSAFDNFEWVFGYRA
jgi:beta-glucosidase